MYVFGFRLLVDTFVKEVYNKFLYIL